uniref:ATP-dependent DNA helicase n=1 Tax=Amphimedon queenslandica TaxID=400682 RepID=A0A1X7UUS6_AMPQE
MSTGDDDVFNPGPLERYQSRPDGEPYDTALRPDDNNNHQNLCGQNIEQNIGDIEDALTLDSISRRHFSDSEFEATITSLNDSQRVPYEKVLEYSRAVHDFQMRTRESMPSPFCTFITGGAGTGKSHVISVIKKHLERAYIGAGNACILMAPTGVAAFNIGGLTIHQALSLSVEHGNSTGYRKLGAERLMELRQSWKYVNTIIIDEISMVSYLTMSFIHQRLTEIKGTDDSEVLFGGLNVIAVGHFFQLPPVRDKFVFQDGRGYNPGSTHLWRDEFKLIELTQNMRQ